MLDPLTRQITLSKLPPLPHFERLPLSTFPTDSSTGSPTPRAGSFALTHPYPTFNLPASTQSLPLPPRPKPNLPPRPVNRPASSQGSSRFGSPFASLFGKSTSGSSTAPVARSPTPSVVSADENSSLKDRDDGELSATNGAIEISAFAIDRRISRKDVGKVVCSALKAELITGMAGLPTWVIDRVHAFASPLYPLIKTSALSAAESMNGTRGNQSSNFKPPAYQIPAIVETVDEIADHFQEFYEKLEAEMRAKAKKKDLVTSNNSEEEPATERIDPDESKIRDAMEIVERTLTMLFYDR